MQFENLSVRNEGAAAKLGSDIWKINVVGLQKFTFTYDYENVDEMSRED